MFSSSSLIDMWISHNLLEIVSVQACQGSNYGATKKLREEAPEEKGKAPHKMEASHIHVILLCFFFFIDRA